jgi:hypothetical protein
MCQIYQEEYREEFVLWRGEKAKIAKAWIKDPEQRRNTLTAKCGKGGKSWLTCGKGIASLLTFSNFCRLTI